ncbi:hypothetical protein CLH62_14645 [Marinobacter guineae]|uniref:Uncharacterized protein n=1 Tax=Marinobacter guineae TaxID=432303 RepID=A0A2G1VBY0_9GAMM|nr:hypothetical protein [Marinobacter guineae]PHQ24170.1 hypothetical protein CLH62_14645 [Marinobacter guineae]
MQRSKLNIINTPETLSSEVRIELDALEQAASAIRGLASVLISDRIKQDEDEEGTMDSATYGGVIYALEAISGQINNLCCRIDTAAVRELRNAAARSAEAFADAGSQP